MTACEGRRAFRGPHHPERLEQVRPHERLDRLAGDVTDDRLQRTMSACQAASAVTGAARLPACENSAPANAACPVWARNSRRVVARTGGYRSA